MVGTVSGTAVSTSDFSSSGVKYSEVVVIVLKTSSQVLTEVHSKFLIKCLKEVSLCP